MTERVSSVRIMMAHLEEGYLQYHVNSDESALMAYKVLVAGNKLDFRQFLHRVLSANREFEVVGEANDAHQACELAKENKADLLILDIDIKRDSENLKNFSADCPGMKVILTSYYDFKEYAEIARKVNASAFIPKTRLSTQSILDILTERN